MMHTHAMPFIQDLAIIMVISGIIIVIFHRFKQPVVLGYIIAGMIIGPYTPPFSYIQNEATIKTLAELGVIFLMFSLGLEFNLHKLKKVGITGFILALLEIILMTGLGYGIGRLLKWSPIDSIFLGTILAISSTTIVLKALEELGMKNKRFAQFIYGVLVCEDICAVIILTILSSLTNGDPLHITNILMITTKISFFLVLSLFIGILLVPKILAYISKFKHREMLLISVLGLCFAFCLLVMKLGYNAALGAFVIGVIIGESRELYVIEQLIIPLRDMFSAIFFVSIGLLFNPKALIDYTIPIIVITVAVIIARSLIGSVGTFLAGKDIKTSIRVGMGLAQIGEFSFIIASLGITLNITSHFLFPIAVAVAIITSYSTHYFIKHSESFSEKIYTALPNNTAAFLDRYTSFIKQVQLKKIQAIIRKPITRSILKMVMNTFIIMIMIFAADYVTSTPWGEMLAKVIGDQFQKIIIWSIAILLSLPFLRAVHRITKISTAAFFAKKFNVRKNEKFSIKLLRIISEIIAIIFLLGLILFFSFLSSFI